MDTLGGTESRYHLFSTYTLDVWRVRGKLWMTGQVPYTAATMSDGMTRSRDHVRVVAVSRDRRSRVDLQRMTVPVAMRLRLREDPPGMGPVVLRVVHARCRLYCGISLRDRYRDC